MSNILIYLYGDFYHSDQSEEESIPSFATQIEGLLSQIRDRFPDKLPHQEEQRLLKDNLLHSVSGIVSNFVLQTLTLIICISLKSAERLRKRKSGTSQGSNKSHGGSSHSTPPPRRMSWQNNSNISSIK